MFEIIDKLCCPVCLEPVQLDDKVFVDMIHTIIHQKCYYKYPTDQLPVKYKGTYRKMLLKYPFFNENQAYSL
jgi:hypothetical protein